MTDDLRNKTLSTLDSPSRKALRTLSAFELSKGIVAVAVGIGLEVVGPNPIRAFIGKIISRFNLHPDHGVLANALKWVDPQSVHMATLILLIYAGVRFMESWGLWHARAWGSWLGCIGTALYLPMDGYALHHHPGPATLMIFILNLLITGYLALDLRRRYTTRQ